MRLAFHTFSIPIPELRCGYYSAVYFLRQKEILEMEGIKSRVTMQVFHKEPCATVCGIDEVLAILRLGTGHWQDSAKMEKTFTHYIEVKKRLRYTYFQNDHESIQHLHTKISELRNELNHLWVDTHEDLKIKALHDGDKSTAYKSVLTIEGQATEFSHLESVYLGILARSTKIASNTTQAVQAAQGKHILFFADRYDRWHNQVADGYAALKSGAYGVATNAMGAWWGIDAFGTIPHSMIAIYKGNTTQAMLDFHKHFPGVHPIALVDFHNNCVQTSLDVAKAFKDAGKELWGVRLDTSSTMVDESILPQMGTFPPTGVCPQLVTNVRQALDAEGFERVKIVVSGGFNAKRIHTFEQQGLPVNAYGIGSSLLQNNIDYTADIVFVNNQALAKKGRSYQPDTNLKVFSWQEIEHPNNP